MILINKENVGWIGRPSLEDKWFDSIVRVFSSVCCCFKGILLAPKQVLGTESSSKMIKNTFYFTLKTFFNFKIFKFLSWRFGHVEKGLLTKDKANLKFCDVTTSDTRNYNTDIVVSWLSPL